MNSYFELSLKYYRLLFLRISFVLIFFIPNSISAQELKSSVISSGGNANKDLNISLTYTVGESIATAKTIDNAIIVQGFEQPKLEKLSVSIFEDNLSFPVKIYPNPTKGPFNIDVETKKNIAWNLSIYNLQAKIMGTYPIHFGYNSFSLNQFPAASYLIVISSNDGKKVFSHIIEKIN